MEDWSLQAIVRGSSGEFSSNYFEDFSGFQHLQLDHDFYSSYPELLDMAMDSTSVEDLYKPFFPDQNNYDFQDTRKENCDHKQNMESDQSSGSTDKITTPKYRRRKTQQKREVIQVSAVDLASDKWAWRKYGQKPIKGSPYPRSYYRCSSSKGCLARKQVEQSCTEPGMFIITYTAEHSHSLPTRRNSLSGTVRQKFPSPRSPNMINEKPQDQQYYPANINDSSSSLMCFSSNTRSDHHPQLDQEQAVMMTQEQCDDDFFSCFDNFDDFVSDKASTQQFSMRPCSGYVN